MGILDRLKRISLADGTSKSMPAGGGTEVGVTGEIFAGAFKEEELRSDTLKIDDYIKMRQNDGTVNALYSILTLPIRANKYKFEADEDDVNEEQAQFVRDLFMEPPHKGGMSTPFPLVLSDMLRAVLEGFRVFELVFDIKDGKIIYKKIASRDARTVTLRRNDQGEYDGFHQRANYAGQYFDVVVQGPKSFLFTHNKDKNFLYGESSFKAAAYHYTRKHKLYYLGQLAAQVGAVPPIIVQGEDGVDKTVKAKILSEISRIGVKTTAYLRKDFTATPLDVGKGRVDVLPLIDHHDTQMARSVLAHHTMLGTTGSRGGGSHALSQDQSAWLISAMKGMQDEVENHINYYLIPQLIDLNFAKPAYPTFKFDDLEDKVRDAVSAAFDAIITAGQISPTMANEIEQKMADNLGIDQDELKVAKEQAAADQATKDAEAAKLAASGATPPAAPTDVKKKNFSDQQWHRPLTTAERRVQFSQLNSKFDALSESFNTDAQTAFTAIKDDAIKRLGKILENRDLQAIDNFELSGVPAYKYVLIKHMRDAYEYAKRATANELTFGAPATNRDTTTFINQSAGAVIDKQVSDLTFQIKTAVLSELRKNNLSEVSLSVGDVLNKISQMFQSFLGNQVLAGGAVGIAQAVNRGRDDVFSSSPDDIAVYQYSAILDTATCLICADLDGSVVDYAGYLATEWVPPIHINCRCIWVAILNTQTEIPDITGLPNDPGGTSAPQL